MQNLARFLTHTLSRFSSTTIFLVAALMFAPAFQSVHGQGITGSMTGTVTDPSGAIVAGASVTIRNVATDFIRKVSTSDAGTYTVTQLLPGTYSVKVDKTAYKTFEQKDITVQIDQVAVINAQLQIGSQQETVEVTTAPPVIQTEDSSVGLVVDSHNIQNIPLNGRLGVMGLIALAPGVQGAGAQDQLADRGVTPSIGTGSRNAYGGMGNTLDGADNKEVTLQRSEAEIPSLDALEEFKVITTGAPAEFNEPAQVIVVTKSGSNMIHGEALEYNRSKGTARRPTSEVRCPAPPMKETNSAAMFQVRSSSPISTTARIAPSFSWPLKASILRSPSTTTRSSQPPICAPATSPLRWPQGECSRTRLREPHMPPGLRQAAPRVIITFLPRRSIPLTRRC